MQLLAWTRDLHGNTKRALIVSWDDQDAKERVLKAMSLGETESLAHAPVAERDEQFHRTISELLEEWDRWSGIEWLADKRMGAQQLHVPGLRHIRLSAYASAEKSRLVVRAVMMVVRVRTGLPRAFSTPGLAGMAAAGLPVPELDPVVAQEQPQLAAERHRLSQVSQEERAPRARHVDPRLPDEGHALKGS